MPKARELRDRYLEHVAQNPQAMLPGGNYGVSRALPQAGEKSAPLLEAA